jgi:glycosyltransferase involved in cell wall biosynthesis
MEIDKTIMTDLKVSIIIPVYNEANTIGVVVEQIRALYPEFEVIVVDDGSSDKTDEVAASAGAFVCKHPYNIGNGSAIKTGIRAAMGDVLVFMDGDGQHDPKEIAPLLNYIPHYDMAVAARPKGTQASIGRAFGNRLFNCLASYVAKFPIQDLTSGFRAVKAGVANNFLYLLPNGYSYPTTLTLCVLRSGRSVKYFPINANKRVVGKSKIKIFKDGVRFFLIIVKICTLFSPFRVFLPVSFFTFLMGLGYYLYVFIAWGRFTNMGVLLFITSVLIFMMGLISEQICQMRFERSEGVKLR